MAHQLLIRDVPPNLSEWIERERHSLMMSKKDFLLHLLREAAGEEQGTLFNAAVDSPASAAPVIGSFSFTDFFAGIGGFRLALQRQGGRCAFTCEWDRFAQKTYREWFGDVPAGDIHKIDPASIPDHDVLAAGFPCQPFSIAGVSKKNSLGREHGFKDLTQGTLFFHLATIIERKRPPVVLLENVKNLVSHDGGRTWDVIKGTLEDLRYRVFHRIIDARHFVPQHRERIFVVCFDRDVFGDNPAFQFPELPAKPGHCLKDILESKVDPRYTLSNHLWKYLQDYARRHREKGNGFGFGLADLGGITRTLSARYHKDGSEILIPQGRGRNPRRLTPRECARLMGFDDSLPIVVSDTQAYRQFGNALVPAVAESVARAAVRTMLEVADVQPRCLLKRGLKRMAGVA